MQQIAAAAATTAVADAVVVVVEQKHVGWQTRTHTCTSSISLISDSGAASIQTNF